MKMNIIINKENKLKSDYIPDNLVLYQNNYAKHFDINHQILVNKEALDQFKLMAKDAIKEGYNIVIDSAYRSYYYQQVILDTFINKYGLEAYERVALPGTSEHQTGLAIDISVIKDGKYIVKLLDKISEMNWLFQNAYKYGYILRYPKGKEHITGYKYEPWHFRYVGIEIATIIYNNNITLEEYCKETELITV